MKGQKETKKKKLSEKGKRILKADDGFRSHSPIFKNPSPALQMTAFSNVMQCSSPKLLSVKQSFLDTPVIFLLSGVCTFACSHECALKGLWASELCLWELTFACIKDNGPTVWGRTPHGYWHQHVWLCEHMEAFCANKKGHKQQKKDAWTKQLFKKRLRFIARRKKKQSRPLQIPSLQDWK